MDCNNSFEMTIDDSLALHWEFFAADVDLDSVDEDDDVLSWRFSVPLPKQCLFGFQKNHSSLGVL